MTTDVDDWRQTDDQPAPNRDQKRRREYPKVRRKLPRLGGRRQIHQRDTTERDAHEPATRTAGKTDQHTLGDQLPYEAAASRANGGTNRYLSCSRHGSRKQQRRHVRGGDQKKEENSAHQQQERLAVLAAQQ